MNNIVIPLLAADQARVNVTWDNQNGDLPDPVPLDATDAQVRAWATEAVRSGNVPGVREDVRADLTDFMIDRCDPTETRPWSLLMIRPKTAFGR